jgi:aspartate/methionine/tyrosine aminotransferase
MGSPRVAKRLEDIRLSLIRRVLGAAPEGSINLGFGEPDFATPASIVSAARAALETPRLGYTANTGLPALREAVARAYAPAGAGPEWVCVTVGAEEALLVALLTWVDPGDEVLVPDPGYPAYAALVRIAGATPVPYRLPEAGGFRFELSALEEGIGPRARAVVINSPANPSGSVMRREDMARVRELARARELLVVSDEVYRELWLEEPAASFWDEPGDGIVVGSLSKSASMTGWRLGWAIAPPDRIEWMTVTHQYAVTCAPTHSQWAALAAFEDEAKGELSSWRRELSRRRDLLVSLVEGRLGWRCVVPEGTFYLLAEAAPDGRSLDLAVRLLESGKVVTIPGEAFGDEARRYLRLSFSVSEGEIREAVDRLERALATGS